MDQEAYNIARRQRRAKRKALGLCTGCSEPAVEGGTLCQRHREMCRKAVRKYKQKVGPKELYYRRASQYTYRKGTFKGEIPLRNESREYRNRDQRARQLAKRLGYVLRRCGARHPGIFWGGTYGLTLNGRLIIGDSNHGYGFKLDVIEVYLHTRLEVIEWRRENGATGTNQEVLHGGTQPQ